MAVVGVAGATGALGKEVLAVLDKTSWRPERVVALASARSEVPSVDYGEESVPVDDLATVNLEDLDAIVLAVPGDVAREVGERAIGDGVAVVDCSGVFVDDGDVPLVVPWVNPEALAEPPLRGVLAIPQAPAILLASVLGPLRRAGLVGAVDATVLVPASAAGRAGIDELSRQVVALFNAGTPPRKVFEQGLAFDLLPSVGTPQPDGWTDEERRARRELEALLGSFEGAVTLVGVPVFSGTSATLHVRTERPVDPVGLGKILEAGGAQVPAGRPRTLPRPRRVEGHPFAQVGRIRLDPDGHGVHLWLSFDNLRGTAAVAVSAAAALVKARRP